MELNHDYPGFFKEKSGSFPRRKWLNFAGSLLHPEKISITSHINLIKSNFIHQKYFSLSK
jgi:hypothetical protein